MATKRTRRRPAPKKRAKKVVAKTPRKKAARVAKPKPSPEICSGFACKAPAVQIVRRDGRVIEAFCEKHKYTAADIAFRERMQDAEWMLAKGVPALRKLARDYPRHAKKPLAQTAATV